MERPATSSPTCASGSRSLGLSGAALLLACSIGSGSGDQLTAGTFGSASGASDSGDESSSDDASDEDTSSTSASIETGDEPGCGALSPCDGACVDTQTDPENCGGCGITCAVPNALAECVAGQCGLLECFEGWGNCDGLLATGCESESSCVSGVACQTVCGSVGVTACNACDPVCQTMDEVCNAMDDDCNGQCDEGPLPGCRVGVHRANGGALGHLYTLDLAEAQSGGFNLESMNFFHVYASEVEGLQPFHRCLKANGKRLYTTAADCEGAGQLESILGHVAPDARCGAQPLYRVWHAGNNAHFYTTSAAERDNAVANLGYADEGVAGYVWSSL